MSRQGYCKWHVVGAVPPAKRTPPRPRCRGVRPVWKDWRLASARDWADTLCMVVEMSPMTGVRPYERFGKGVPAIVGDAPESESRPFQQSKQRRWYHFPVGITTYRGSAVVSPGHLGLIPVTAAGRSLRRIGT